jgi:hypothetical protein
MPAFLFIFTRQLFQFEISNKIVILGNSIGDCTIDSFVVSSPGNVASPAICGFNTKQHSNFVGNYLIFFILSTVFALKRPLYL